jgi:phage tail sheath protein FI
MAGVTDSPWRFIPVRRLALNIERSIRAGTVWVTDQKNDPLLWEGVQRQVGAFLEGLWAQGALEGREAEEAYFVRCGTDTMTEEEIAAGLVRFKVGFAAMRPSEFYMLDFEQRSRS